MALTMLCFVACEPNEPRIPTTWRKYKMNISIPIDDQSTGRKKISGLGDPGTYEYFRYPRYLYIFYVWEDKDNPSICEVHYDWPWSEKILSPESWSNGKYHGNLQYDGDTIFTYTGELEMLLPVSIEQYNVRIYAAMSYHPLANLRAPSISTEEDIRNLQFTFDADNDSLPQSLENIYSTPYNYEVNGQYYATLPKTSGTFNLLLYHVASKVDLIWNVSDDQQTSFYVESIVAQQLYKKSAYIFRPNENEGKPTGAGENYSLNIKSAGDVGMQYKGRSYFYTIPYYDASGGKNYMDIVLDTKFMEGSTENACTLTLRKAVDISQPFVPWIRGNLQFTTMPTRTQEKIVD